MENGILAVIIAALAPVSELRGAIPLGLAMGYDPIHIILISIIFNIIAFFPIYFGMTLLYDNVFSKWKIVHKLVERTHRRGKPFVERYGFLGLTLFVAIPLPITGLWTGTALAWLLGLDWKRSFAAVCVGVLIAATIVSSISLGILELF
jgi:uncharacterized membrane protein